MLMVVKKYPAGRTVRPDVLNCEAIIVTFVQSLLSKPSITADRLGLSGYHDIRISPLSTSFLLEVRYN